MILSLALALAAADAQTIVVTGHTTTTDPVAAQLRATPGGVDLVPAAAFEDRLAVSLRDALAFSPGVYTQPRFGQEVRLSVRGSGISRGFHMRGLMLLQDGVPINLADNNGDFQELDPQVFESIAVYRGGNALRFGASTLGGAIDAATPTGRTAPRFEARMDGGAFDTLRAKLATGFATERGDAFLALTGDTSDGDRDHAFRRALRFNGNAGIRLTDTIETRVYASLNHIRQELPGAITAAVALDDPRQANAGAVAGDQARDIDSLRLQSRTTVALPAGSLAFGGFYNAKRLYHPIFQVVDQRSNDRGVYARAELDGTLGALPVAASLGSTARFGTTVARQYVNLAGRRGTQTADALQIARTIDTHAELRIAPVARLWIVAGAVHTHGRREVENRRVTARSGSASFDRLAPKIGLLYEPVADVQLYANYSRSIELPGFSELNQAQVDPGFIDLDPQRAWTAEIGTRGRIGIAAWDVTAYRADLRGELLQFTIAQDVPATTFNAGRTRHQGIEAGLTLDLAPWLRLRQVYQRNDFRFRDDARYANNRLPVIAPHLYRADLRLGSDALSISPSVEWLPKGAFADYINATRLSGYAMLGVGARATVGTGVTLFVDARNLTAKRAIGDISAAIDARVASAALYYPIERRAVYAGLRTKL